MQLREARPEIHFQENLMPQNKDLFWQSHTKASEMNYQFVQIKDGKMFGREKLGDTVLRIVEKRRTCTMTSRVGATSYLHMSDANKPAASSVHRTSSLSPSILSAARGPMHGIRCGVRQSLFGHRESVMEHLKLPDPPCLSGNIQKHWMLFKQKFQ